MSSLTDMEKAIEDHRNMLILSKNLSDFQINNLKTWPMLVFDNVDKCEIDYNFFDDNGNFVPGHVHFNFTFKDGIPSHQVKTATENLNSWVKSVFFSSTEVKLLNEGEEIKAEDHDGSN
jgi:hypothetical protein